jgi:hypothetical protein
MYECAKKFVALILTKRKERKGKKNKKMPYLASVTCVAMKRC